MSHRKSVYVIGGGTVFHIRNHLALSAPAYGETARAIERLAIEQFKDMDVKLQLTKMAGGDELETNDDIAALIDRIVDDPASKVVFMNVAMCDFEATVMKESHKMDVNLEPSNLKPGKHADRLKSTVNPGDGHVLFLEPAEKVLQRIRKTRKDIFLVAFKTTTGASEDEQYASGLNLLKRASCNLVLANDVVRRRNMIITPEEARYHVTTDRNEALRQLVEMAWLRSHLTFTRSTVIDGTPVAWDDTRVPASLRAVVEHCISRGAYKPFRGATVGHFACKLNDTTFLTSIRKSNFNDIKQNGLVMVKTDGPDTVLAYGARPSVGGQSQRIVFNDHPGMDCIVHFHCPLKPGSVVPVRSQREFECGSHQCGKNTSDGLGAFWDIRGGIIKAVHLDQHGPNVVFNSGIDPQLIIDFIEENFDLEDKTGGYIKPHVFRAGELL